MWRRENIRKDKGPSLNVAQADRRIVLPVVRKGRPEGQHRGSDHGSTRTIPKHQICRGRGLPQQIGPKVHAVQRRSWECLLHISFVQVASWDSIHQKS